MSAYFAAGRLSEEEKQDILSQHREIYNGYQTMQPKVSNTQPLYVQDFAKDKVGAVISNKGNVKGYTNVGINEGIFDNLLGKKHKRTGKISHGGHEIDVWSDGDEILYGHPKKHGEVDAYTKDKLVYDNLDDLKRAIDNINKDERGEKTGGADWQSSDEPMDMSGSAVPSFFPKSKKIKNPDFKGFAVQETKEVCDECGAMPMDESKEVCSECGGIMSEGECSECGWKGEVGAMEEHYGDDDMDDYEDLAPSFKDDEFVGMQKPSGDVDDYEDLVPSFKDDKFVGMQKPLGDMEIEKSDVEKEKKSFRPGVDLGKSFEKFKGMFEDTGKLSDIYNVEDLGDSDFDYVEGGGNDFGTFEKMHHMKKLKSEGEFEDPDNEDDGFEDLQVGDSEMYEQGYTGGGNAPDMDLSNIEPAYDFISDGPMAGGDVYPTESEMDEEWEMMESAWSDEELDETDVSGVQGIYGDMEPAFDFDSEGPGKAGPYQHSEWGGGSTHGYEGEDEDAYWEKDLEDDELDLDLTKFNPEDKSWSEISDYTGDDELSHLDEDEKLSVENQKNKIMEMFNRMKVIK